MDKNFSNFSQDRLYSYSGQTLFLHYTINTLFYSTVTDLAKLRG